MSREYWSFSRETVIPQYCSQTDDQDVTRSTDVPIMGRSPGGRGPLPGGEIQLLQDETTVATSLGRRIPPVDTESGFVRTNEITEHKLCCLGLSVKEKGCSFVK